MAALEPGGAARLEFKLESSEKPDSGDKEGKSGETGALPSRRVELSIAAVEGLKLSDSKIVLSAAGGASASGFIEVRASDEKGCGEIRVEVEGKDEDGVAFRFPVLVYLGERTQKRATVPFKPGDQPTDLEKYKRETERAIREGRIVIPRFLEADQSEGAK